MENKKNTLLIIDDDAQNRQLLVRFLEANDQFVIYSAPSGKVGLEIAFHEIPNVIILDWQMPEMNGIEVLSRLKSNSATKEIPVIMFTGIMTDTRSLRQSLQLGAHDFLRKPIEAVELEARINAVIRQEERKKEIIEQQLKIISLEKKQLQIELDAREREVINYAKSLSSKNELFSQFLDGMKQFIKVGNLNTEQASHLNALTNELKQNLNILKSYEEFDELFAQLNPQFIDSLKSLGIPLTENERQLITYIRLNLSNKEIAALLFVSIAAVEKAKYRLKSKLNIEPNINLNDFILSI